MQIGSLVQAFGYFGVIVWINPTNDQEVMVAWETGKHLCWIGVLEVVCK